MASRKWLKSSLYHMAYLNAPDSPIKQLTTIFNAYPLCEETLLAANQTSCGARGMESYSLLGELFKSALLQVPINTPENSFCINSNNMLALYDRFKSKFLNAAIASALSNQSEALNEELVELLTSHIPTAELADVVSDLKTAEDLNLMAHLAKLLPDERIKDLAEKGYGCAFYLLRHKPELVDELSHLDLDEFLQGMGRYHVNVYGLAHELGVMLTLFNRVNKKFADKVYVESLKLVVENPHLLDDDALLLKLKKYKGNGCFIKQQCSLVESEFLEQLQVQASHQPMVLAHYHLIEDAWADAARKSSALNLISDVSSKIPASKYELWAMVANQIIVEQSTPKTCQELADLMGISTVLSQASVSEYERFLIELLITVDCPHLRAECIENLSRKYDTPKDWMSSKDHELTLLARAAQHENPGFVEYLFKKLAYKINRFEINHIVIQSAKEGRWHVVGYLIQNKSDLFNKDLLRLLYNEACHQGQTVIIEQVYDKIDIKNKTFSKGLNQAIDAGHIDVIDVLLAKWKQTEQPPNVPIHRLFKKFRC